jgi:hypothetical protein
MKPEQSVFSTLLYGDDSGKCRIRGKYLCGEKRYMKSTNGGVAASAASG